MKASELRIGNLVQTTQGIFKVTKISENEIDICPFLTNEPFTIFINTARPITLTEELLLRFGFEKIENNWKCLDLHFAIISWERLAGLTLSFEKESIFLPHIKYAHQLQNLYFALTGTELTLKD